MKNSDVIVMTEHVSTVANGGPITPEALGSLEAFARIGARESGGLMHYRLIENLAGRYREIAFPDDTTSNQEAPPSNEQVPSSKQDAPASVSSALDSRLNDDDDELPDPLAIAGVGGSGMGY